MGEEGIGRISIVDMFSRQLEVYIIVDMISLVQEKVKLNIDETYVCLTLSRLAKGTKHNHGNYAHPRVDQKPP